MKISLLERLPNTPLIDIAGGYVGPYSGQVPNITFGKMSQSDFFVSPHDFWDIRNSEEYKSYLKSISRIKPLLLFNRSDFPGDLRTKNVFYLQNTIEIGSVRKNRVIIPYNVQDVDKFTPLDYTSIPKLSFVGYVPRITAGRVIRSIYPNFHPIKKNSVVIRNLLINKTRRYFPESQIIPRGYYGGSLKLIPGDPDKHRNEYLRSIVESHISLCPRGDGNGSQRFFETLAAGRIPLVPDTNIVYPYIKDRNYLSILDIRTLSSNMNLVISDYWRTLNNKRLEELFLFNRLIYRNQWKYSVFLCDLFSSTPEDFYRSYVVAS